MFFREISASLYAWDLADEGIERILDNVQEMTNCNSVYLIALMHHEKRPLTDFFYPHNPVRKTYCPEDSRAYWHPDLSFYDKTPIKPRTSERDLLKDTDWLATCIEAVRKRGLKTGVEISHTIIDKERAAGEFEHCMQHNIYGDRISQLICFNNPDSREYAVSLFAEMAGRYDLDYIQTCLIPFSAGRSVRGSSLPAARLLGTVLGGCFCEHCARAAAAKGLDYEKIKQDLLVLADSVSNPTLEQAHELALLCASNTSQTAILMENPSLYEWLNFRRDSLTDFFKEVHTRSHAAKADIDIRLNAYISADAELSGIDLRALKPHLDSIRSSDYSEQSGDPARLEFKRKWLLSVRRAVGDDMYFLSAIGVRPKATPELIRQGVVVSAECGADGLTMGHYDGASYSNLRAIKEGMEIADVEMA
ncbi:MAG: hypothetical protein HQ592_00055 [Planctomycetes bacterium]|nr:hypothetical protein [Planctomycetota bacterium]